MMLTLVAMILQSGYMHTPCNTVEENNALQQVYYSQYLSVVELLSLHF